MAEKLTLYVARILLARPLHQLPTLLLPGMAVATKVVTSWVLAIGVLASTKLSGAAAVQKTDRESKYLRRLVFAIPEALAQPFLVGSSIRREHLPHSPTSACLSLEFVMLDPDPGT